MNSVVNVSGSFSPAGASSWSRFVAAWNGFWFTPADPTALGAIRLLTGIITFYTLFAYSFDLQALMGEDAWLDLPLRQEHYRRDPVYNIPFEWTRPDEVLDVLTRGRPYWSVWFHVTDPVAMNVVHTGILICSFLFFIGLGTRITSAITWFGALSYIHRAPASVFGVDTMMTVLLLYLMIGPSGAALSVDRLIARWRAKRNGLPAPPIKPMVSANLAIRLIQIHACIIYASAGLSKLQGPSWWFGTAPWGTMANFEFSPMHLHTYVALLKFMAQTRWIFETLMTAGALGTLVFEIGYPFAIWQPSLRKAWLWMAVLLHLGIGMLMGLRTFSLMMLGFNIAFLSPEAVRRSLRMFTPKAWRDEAIPIPAEMPGPQRVDTAIAP